MIKEGIQKAVAGIDLSEAEMIGVMNEIMEGAATPAQVGAFLTALNMKGETVDEITGAARVMREKVTRIEVMGLEVTDTVGTGGDGARTFNISTATALVAAGAGVKIAKHGNRAATSRCGSADVLEALGVNVALAPRDVEDCIARVGIGFLFAPLLHGAMKHAVGPRREIGVRTIFNILGPLTNPAGAQRLLIGVFSDHYAPLMAQALERLGAREAMVVHGNDGLDEIALSGPTKVYHLRGGRVEPYELDPADYGLEKCGVEELAGGSPEESAAIIREVFEGRPGPRRDVVVLNAAATIAVAGAAADMHEGLEAARSSIDSGAARDVLERWAGFTAERAGKA